jgi:hypothetical protein
MRKILSAGAIIGMIVGGLQTPAFAACDSVCHQKCVDTAPNNVARCVAIWSELNNIPAQAQATENQFYVDHPEYRHLKHKKYKAVQ